MPVPAVGPKVAVPAAAEATAAGQAPELSAADRRAKHQAALARRLRLSTFGSSAWGGRGLHRALSAFSVNPYAFVLTFGDDYYSAQNVFLRGDKDTQTSQEIHIVFSPVEGLEVGFSQYSVANKYQALSPRVLQVQGNPALHLKYGYALWPDFAVGAYAGLQLPTSAEGTGLQASAFSVPLSVMASYVLRDRVEFVGNIGYTIDQSRKLFTSRDPDAVARFAYGINRINQLTYALGAQGHLSAGGVVDFAPYVELTGGMGFGSAATRVNAPFRGTLGLKLYLTQSRSIELSAGADMRLGGPPQNASPFAGVPPWRAFGQLSFHINDRRPSLHKPGAASCQTTADCASGLSCYRNACTLVAADANANRGTFVLTGAVVDGTTGEPVTGARLTFSDFQNTVLAGDLRSGQFATWPLAAAGEPMTVHIEAPGYGSTTQAINRGTPGEVKQLTLRMDSNAQVAQGSIKGSIKDGRTGRPVRHAVVFIPVLNKRVDTAEDGAFEADVRVGLYQVLISAKGYVTQKKQVRVREGDVVILNADLLPKRGHRR